MKEEELGWGQIQSSGFVPSSGSLIYPGQTEVTHGTVVYTLTMYPTYHITIPLYYAVMTFYYHYFIKVRPVLFARFSDHLFAPAETIV